MALVGATTRDRTAARMRSLQRLAGHFLDIVSGLPTLKVFGRAKAQARAIAEVTDRYRAATMATLRLTFLSSLILELLATVSVALVAVAVGLRLLGGDMTLPGRALRPGPGARGLPAAARPRPALPRQRRRHEGGRGALRRARGARLGATGAARREAPGTAIDVTGLEVTYPGRGAPRFHGVDLAVEPGETVALTGPERLRQVDPAGRAARPAPARRPGRSRSAASTWTSLDLDDWRRQIAWVPQRPHLFARSVADNVRLGRPDATDAEVEAAHRSRRAGRGGAATAPRRRHPARRGGRRPVGRRATAPVPGPRLRPRRAAAAARRAHSQPGRPDRGRRPGGRAAAGQRAAPA